jgi:hypothetical protein
VRLWPAWGHRSLDLSRTGTAPPDQDRGRQLEALTGHASLASFASWADDYRFTPVGTKTKRWHCVDIDLAAPGYSLTDKSCDLQAGGPPRVLLPEIPEPFCLFLDELPACTPDVQKAFYSLLPERRLLPLATWVVSAGNRMEDRALVRALSSALVNRVFILQVRADVKEWLAWARRSGVHPDVVAFVTFMPDALFRLARRAPP